MKMIKCVWAIIATAIIVVQANFVEAKIKTKEVVVVCSKPGASIQHEIDSADGPTVITVSGGCVENVVIEIDGITLKGDDLTGGAIQAADAGLPVVTVRRATGAVIDDLTLSGGNHGLVAVNGAFVEFSDSVIENNTFDGLRLIASDAVVTDTAIDNNGRRGVLLAWTSSLRMSGGSASSNGTRGIHLLYSSSAQVANVMIDQNGERAFVVATGSSATVEGLTVTDSGDRGVWAWDHSTIEMNGGNTVTGNGKFGIREQNASTIHLFGQNTVTGNTSHDVSAYEKSFIVVEGSGGASVSTIGVAHATRGSDLTLSGGTIGTVLVDTGSTATFSGHESGPTNVTGNVSCTTLGASATFASDALADGPTGPSSALVLTGATTCDTLLAQGF